jgi:hypothetical protein
VLADVATVKAAWHEGTQEGGRNVHVVPGGKFPHENWTAWAEPASRVAVTFVEALPPGWTEPDRGLRPIEKLEAGGGETERSRRKVVVRLIVPSEAATVTRCDPGGLLADVDRTRFVEQVGRQKEGVNAHDAPDGRSVQENSMSWVKPDVAVAVTVVVVEFPGATGLDSGRTSSEKSKVAWAVGLRPTKATASASTVAMTSTTVTRRTSFANVQLREEPVPFGSSTAGAGRADGTRAARLELKNIPIGRTC